VARDRHDAHGVQPGGESRIDRSRGVARAGLPAGAVA